MKRKKESPRLQDPITPPGVYVHTENDILDFAVIITEHLLDNCPGYLAPRVLEQDGKYTEYTFDFQDFVEEAVARAVHSRKHPLKK